MRSVRRTSGLVLGRPLGNYPRPAAFFPLFPEYFRNSNPLKTRAILEPAQSPRLHVRAS